MTVLDKSAAEYLARLKAAGGAALETLSAEEARQRFLDQCDQDKDPLAPVAAVFEVQIDGLRLKCWRGVSAPSTGAPALLYLHGGGWLLGSPETHEDICRMIANQAGAVVVSPDYRLAPEHPFPAGLEDCVAALRYVHDNAEALGVDPGKLAVGGDSAGGNLAAVLALMSRDGDLPALAAQLLIYPNTDQSQSCESFRKYSEGFGLTSAAMAWFRDHYLPSKDLWNDWRAAPEMAATLKGVAPAVVILAGHDVLFDEGARYTERLAADSKAIVVSWPGQIHGFLSHAGVIPEAKEAISFLCAGWSRLSGA